jgi:NAD(P)-dependent dehydrogenase (short-subunit alcohol dehydrogenase family)
MVQQQAQVLDLMAAGGRRLVDRVAIITGAGQGHGRATAKRMAQEGAHVMVVDRHEPGATRTVDELREFGAQAESCVADISDPENFKEVAAATKERFGKIDILVNVAGGSMYGPKYGWNYTPDELRANVENNLLTCMWGCWAVLPYMVEQGSGAIVNFGSHAVRNGMRLGYAAAKGGVYAVTTSLAMETAQMGVRVNAVVPHFNDGAGAGDKLVTRMPGQLMADRSEEERAANLAELQARHGPTIPMGRGGAPKDIAAAVTFLASDDAAFVTGHILCVGGGAFCIL